MRMHMAAARLQEMIDGEQFLDAYAAAEEVPRSLWITFFVPSNAAFAAAAKRFDGGAIPQRMLIEV